MSYPTLQLCVWLLNVCSVISVVGCFLAILLLNTFPGWHEEIDEHGSERDVKPFPSRNVSGVVLLTQSAAAGCALCATVWQHCSAVAYASAIGVARLDHVVTKVGAAASALAWTGTCTQLLTCMLTLIMILSVQTLEDLTDDGRGMVGNIDRGDNDEG